MNSKDLKSSFIWGKHHIFVQHLIWGMLDYLIMRAHLIIKILGNEQ